MVAASSVVTQDLPVFESSDGMFGACPPFAVPSPGGIPDDAAAGEGRVVEFGDAAVAAVGVDAAVLNAVALHFWSLVVDGVVAVAGSSTVDGDDEQVATATEHLGEGVSCGSS